MFELPLDNAEIKKINGHQYYIFPLPATHPNQNNRPTVETTEDTLQTYQGRGSKGNIKLHPDVLAATDMFMGALLDYGEEIDDWSMRSAYIQNSWRPDNASQGAEYLRIIKEKITNDPAFDKVTFPANLEAEAQSVLGLPGDPRLTLFMKHVAQAPGWTPALAERLFTYMQRAYAPRGFNPHTTGFVFDLDFSIWCNCAELEHGRWVKRDEEKDLGAKMSLNNAALQNAVGMWINMYSMAFCFDSYDTGAEVWHMEFRNCPTIRTVSPSRRVTPIADQPAS